MMASKDRIIKLLKDEPGLSDREITDILIGPGAPQQSVNQTCRSLEGKGIIERKNRSDGRIGNYLLVSDIHEGVYRATSGNNIQKEDPLSEDSLKKILEKWLIDQGWDTHIAWGRTQGIDIEAFRGNVRWVIEVKGRGSRNAMRVNYFLAVLGETLQRMNDPNARYSIALPDLDQFRSLWERLPSLAKKRTGISAIFVNEHGDVTLSEMD